MILLRHLALLTGLCLLLLRGGLHAVLLGFKSRSLFGGALLFGLGTLAHALLTMLVLHGHLTLLTGLRLLLWCHGRLLTCCPIWPMLTPAPPRALRTCSSLLLLSGDVFADLCRRVLRHSLKTTHQHRALHMLTDLRACHAGSGTHRRQVHHGQGGLRMVAVALRGGNLVCLHRLHLPLRHRMAAGLLHLGPGRATLLHKGVVMAAAGHDLGHVHALAVDRGALRHRSIDADVGGADKLRDGDEDVAGWAEAVARIAVTIHAIAGTRLGRQRRPAHAVGALPPGHPARRPLAARHPDPAEAGDLHPAAVVVGDPAKGLVGLPGPAEGGPRPAAVPVGPPSGHCDGGLPAVAVTSHLQPAPVGCQILIEERVIGCRRRLLHHTGRWRRGCGALADGSALPADVIRLGTQVVILPLQSIQRTAQPGVLIFLESLLHLRQPFVHEGGFGLDL